MSMHARTHTYRNIYTLDITSIIFLVVVLLFCVREAPLLYIVFLYVRNVMKTTHVFTFMLNFKVGCKMMVVNVY